MTKVKRGNDEIVYLDPQREMILLVAVANNLEWPVDAESHHQVRSETT